MKHIFGVALAVVVAAWLGSSAPAADDKDATAVLDKAIKALGGADKLAAKAFSWKVKGTLVFNGSDNEFTSTSTAQGLDHLRGEFNGDFGGNKITAVTVLKGDKGWRKFGEMASELDKDQLANEKRNLYLAVVPVTLLPLKGKGFKVEAAGTEKVGDKPATVLKVTGPDGKDFKLLIDTESHLPVRMSAKVMGFMGEEYTREWTFDKYKEFKGIKKATKVTSTRDGEKFIDEEVVEFKPLDKADDKTFTEPE